MTLWKEIFISTKYSDVVVVVAVPAPHPPGSGPRLVLKCNIDPFRGNPWIGW